MEQIYDLVILGSGPAGIRTLPRGSWLRPAPEAQSWPLPPEQPLWLMQSSSWEIPMYTAGQALQRERTAQALR